MKKKLSDCCANDPFHLKTDWRHWLLFACERIPKLAFLALSIALPITLLWEFFVLNDQALNTLCAGVTAAIVGLVQLKNSVPWSALWRLGAKRWTLGYILFCALIAALTYYVFHDNEPIKGSGEVAPILVGFLYPVIVFGMLAVAQSSLSNENEGRANQIYLSVVGIFIERIRSNSRRYWDYLSELLIDMSLKYSGKKREEFYEDARARRALLHIMRTILASPNSFEDSERREATIEKIEQQIRFANSEIKLSNETDNTLVENENAEEPQARRWNIYDIIDQFHRVCTPEILLRLIPIQDEVSFQLKDALNADLERIARNKGIKEFEIDKNKANKEAWIQELINCADGTSLEFFRTQHRFYAISGSSRLRHWPNYRLRFCWHGRRWHLITSVLDSCRSCGLPSEQSNATGENS